MNEILDDINSIQSHDDKVGYLLNEITELKIEELLKNE